MRRAVAALFLFSVACGGSHTTRLARDSSPTTTPTPLGSSTSTAPGVASTPTTFATPPPPTTPSIPAPAPPPPVTAPTTATTAPPTPPCCKVDRRAQRWQDYTVGPDGRTLTFRYYAGVEPCSVFDSIDAQEAPTTVTVTVYERDDAAPGQACPMLAKEKHASVTLREPLGSRRVVDGAP